MPCSYGGIRLTSDDNKPVSPVAQTVDATAPHDRLVGTTLGHYRIVGRLGAGGMGVVYRAEDEKLRRAVALKVLPDTSGNEERRQRFLREARSAAAITHANVAVVYQVDEADGRIYIAT
jgi:eukaryotic-like serine/threonine-protein kinase